MQTYSRQIPEGDTIWRTAARLEPALAGRTVTAFEAPRLPRPWIAPGTGITGVEARGKYLLIHFDDGRTLESHMLMSGSWHLYRTGERWQRSTSSARVVLTTDHGWQAVCFAAQKIRIVRSDRVVAHLGPDLTSPSPDLEAAVDRFARHSTETTTLAEALLDQRICCGVGNIYKSETLWACGLDPSALVAAVSVEWRRELVATAHRLLRANLGAGPRTTTGGGLAVYERAGAACLRCDGIVERAVHGVHARSTYWWPGCQTAPGAAPLTSG